MHLFSYDQKIPFLTADNVLLLLACTRLFLEETNVFSSYPPTPVILWNLLNISFFFLDQGHHHLRQWSPSNQHHKNPAVRELKRTSETNFFHFHHFYSLSSTTSGSNFWYSVFMFGKTALDIPNENYHLVTINNTNSVGNATLAMWSTMKF